jgi:hypothetical protein
MKRKRNPTERAAPNKRPMLESSHPASNMHDPGPSRQQHISQSAAEDQHLDGLEDDASELPPLEEALQQETINKAMKVFKELQQEKNKENRPLPSSSRPTYRKRFNDKNLQGEKVGWDDSQEEEPVVKHSNPHAQGREQTQDSEDEGFEEDKRTVNLNRRIAAPRTRQRSPVEEVNSSLRNRRQQDIDVEQVARRRREQVADEDEDEDKEVEENTPPPPTAADARIVAKIQTARGKISTAQTRTPWSEEDEQELVGLIEEHGCSWSQLMRKGQFERETNEVALKDKARNLKVAYLK